VLNNKRILGICVMLYVLAEIAQAGNDASLPERYVRHSVEKRVYDARNLTPPLITAFAAPDSAMRGLAFDGQYLWAANSGDGNSMFGPKIYRLDPDSGTVINTYSGLSNYPCGLAWDGQYLWHSTYVGGIIYQLDTMGLSIVKSFLAPTTHPFDLAWDGTYLYAVKGNQPYISVIDTSTGAEIDSIEATYSSPNVRPFGLAFLGRSAPQLLTCDGNYGSNLVNSWSFNAGAWVDQWAGEPTVYPSGLAYDSVSERLWVSCYELDSIYVYDVSQVGLNDNDPEIVFGTQLDAHPNPFTHQTQIRCMILDPGYTDKTFRISNCELRKQETENIQESARSASEYQNSEMEIYDVSGRIIKSFSLHTTYYILSTEVNWDGRDMHGQQVPPGVYFVRLHDEAASIKLVKLK
jgi:DNA-binding beta-propeller fold protein YncE